MSPVLTIFRKELRSYVMTPYGWVILAFVMALQSVSLSGTLKAFQLAPQKEGILFFILHSPMVWFYFLFIFPLLTMRSLAEEEKTGTLESLLTTPIKTWQVVLGKYFSAYAFYIILWLPMLLYPLLADWSNLIVQWIYGYDAGMVLPDRLADWAGAYAILLLVGLLGFGLVKEGSVAGLCDFLQGHLTFLFLPAGVGLLEHLDLLASSGLALAAVCMVSGFFTFAAAALTVRLVQRIQKGGRREGTDL